ncbi:Bug family tripartite tricarboxylate transporter substrate binding protein [Variovorax sp. RT4R15]|uniref:Bug family tripartite tricarboxylate transporter substrate binding protein n=1 Tax=Variovorax sp. RT4R15 TaxID=3443737 RepID=UPI003F46ACFE
MNNFRRTLLTAAFAAVAVPSIAAADDFPNKPIKIVVPFPAGTIVDAMPRFIASELAKKYRSPVVVENKPGAASTLGAEYVARSNPDGYTLLMASSSTLATVPNLYKKMRYDSAKDLTSLTLVATSPAVVMISPALKINTMPEYIAYLKKHPNELSYVSAGVGGILHLLTEQFLTATDTKMQHVPYQGTNLSITDLNEGRVHMLVDAINLNTIDAGKLKVLAVLSDKRISLLPDVPSITELGYPKAKNDIWFGLAAPSRTPPDILEKLQKDVSEIIKSKEMADKFSPLGLTMVGSTSTEMDALVKSESAKFGQMIRNLNISLD